MGTDNFIGANKAPTPKDSKGIGLNRDGARQREDGQADRRGPEGVN